MKFKTFLNQMSFNFNEEVVTLESSLSKIMSEGNLGQDYDMEVWKETANKIAKGIEDEEFRFKSKHNPTVLNQIGNIKNASIYQKIAIAFLFSNITAADLVKYGLTMPEANRLIDYLHHNFYWYKDSKLWQHEPDKYGYTKTYSSKRMN